VLVADRVLLAAVLLAALDRVLLAAVLLAALDRVLLAAVRGLDRGGHDLRDRALAGVVGDVALVEGRGLAAGDVGLPRRAARRLRGLALGLGLRLGLLDLVRQDRPRHLDAVLLAAGHRRERRADEARAHRARRVAEPRRRARAALRAPDVIGIGQELVLEIRHSRGPPNRRSWKRRLREWSRCAA